MRKFTLLIMSVFIGFSVQAQNLLENGDFEGGATDWFGNAFNIQCDGGNCFNFADVATAGNPFDVNLSQVEEIVQGETYTLTFDASTDPGTGTRTMIAGIGLNEAPFTANTEVVTLTETTQTFELVFTASFGLANSRVLFDMGAEVGIIVIDNVSLVIGGSTGGTPATAAPAPPARDPATVFSIYSDAYSNQPDVVFGAFNVGTQDITEIQIEGDNTQQIGFAQGGGGEFLLVDWGTIVDASERTHFHMDYWTDTPLATGMIANPKWSNHVGDAGETSAFEYTNPVGTFGEWVSIDIPISDFAAGDPTQQRDALRQFILTVVGADNGTRTVFVDNIYLHDNEVLNVNEFDTTSITAYPNPAQSNWSVTSVEPITQISVFDILGKAVLVENPNNTNVTMDISSLPAGMYLANIATAQGAKTIKLIKK